MAIPGESWFHESHIKEHVEDGTDATVGYKRTILHGNDGSGYVEVAVDAEGHLQVDDLSGGGGGGGGTQYDEDSAHTTGDTGTMALGVQNTADAALAGTDGDYAPFQLDENGHLKVHVKAGGTSGGATEAKQDVVITALGDLETELALKADLTETQPVSAATLPLPSGAATNAAQLPDDHNVKVTDVIPGTGATKLGKAINAVVGASDTGVGMLAKHLEDQVHRTSADGDYDIVSLDSLGSVHVNAEAHHVFDAMNATTGWSAPDTDTENITLTSKHVLGTGAIEFDKADTAANSTLAYIEKTVAEVDLGAVSPHDILQTAFYVSDAADIDYVFCRVGTDSSNYNEWRIPGDALTAGSFLILSFTLGDASYTGIMGNGWNPSSIFYFALGVAFSAQNDTLTNITFDEFSYHTNQHTVASLDAEVTSEVSSPNVKVNGWAGSVATNSGTANANTLRVTQATDDTVTVDSTDLDIRDLTATDVVTAEVDIVDGNLHEAGFVDNYVTSGNMGATYAATDPNTGSAGDPILDLPTDSTWRYVSFSNSLDGRTEISFDGGSTADFTLLNREDVTIDFAALGLKVTDDIHVRHDGTAPGTGRLQARGIYENDP